jgi:Zn-dependent protease
MQLPAERIHTVMRRSWKLGQVSGIDVYLHPTFLLILFFPQVTQWGIYGLALVLAGFGCVLLHELGHALMARQYGIGTRDITLYPIGGVARLTRMPRSPGAELLIALAGPAVNFVLVGGLIGLLSLGVLGPLTGAAFAVNLIIVNLVLGLFNLIPAFPMDGGRVLRALLSGWVGRARATSVATGIGRGLALVFGLYSLIQGEWIQVFLAMFIFMAAGAELSSVVAEENLRRFYGNSDGDRQAQGIWTAPPGFQWVHRGDGAWQLAPLFVSASEQNGRRWP